MNARGGLDLWSTKYETWFSLGCVIGRLSTRLGSVWGV